MWHTEGDWAWTHARTPHACVPECMPVLVVCFVCDWALCGKPEACDGYRVVYRAGVLQNDVHERVRAATVCVMRPLDGCSDDASCTHCSVPDTKWLS